MLKKLIARHIRIPLRKPIKHASYERHETDNVLIECHLDNGIVGYGEGVPREYVTGETINSVFDTLRQSRYESLQQEPNSFEDVISRIEQFAFADPSPDPRGIAHHAARCALELSYLDAHGQQFKQPISAVTRLVTPEIHASRDTVQYSTAITSATGAKLIRQALAYRLFGFQQCKVKVGIQGQDDIARLRAIRRWIGSRMHVRVDANEAWSVDEVQKRWNDLRPFDIAWVEQPVAHEAIGDLARIRKSFNMPVMLDESLCGMQDAQRCVQEGWGELFNLRLSKCGGFIRTLRLASFAQQHGLRCQLGCQVGETGILSAAGRHFACSVKGLQALEGSYDHWLVKEPLTTKDMTFGWGGKAPALISPGLGIFIDGQGLDRVTIRQEVLVG